MAFTIFEAYGAASRPEATLRASGYLFLSKGILKRAGNEEATHIQLLFDEESNRLGMNFYDEMLDGVDLPGVRELSQEKSGVSVNILPLLRYYGFPDPKRIGKQVFPVKFEEELAVIDLKPLWILAGPDDDSIPY